jgi:hypothetical protein
MPPFSAIKRGGEFFKERTGQRFKFLKLKQCHRIITYKCHATPIFGFEREVQRSLYTQDFEYATLLAAGLAPQYFMKCHNFYDISEKEPGAE